MAQHSLSSVPSRIFTRKPSLAARILSASLLVLSLLVTLAGLGTAIYLERAPDAVAVTTQAAQPAALPVATNSEPVPFAPTAAPTSPVAPEAPPAVATSPAADAPRPADPSAEPPSAGSSAPLSPSAPPQVAALEAPAAMPALGESGRYWVEYGVFVGERYAQRLQQKLADHGLAASLVATHAPDGRPLMRVRSVALADYVEAREVAERARQAIGIGPLVHRSAGEPTRSPATVPVTSSTRGGQRYWVQFGAFPRAEQAARVKNALSDSGVDTIVATAHAASGRLLFLVRSVELADRDSAMALAHRGQQAANVDFLVGRSREPRHGADVAASQLAASDQAKDSSPRQ
jgi:cell division septation protein DedD